MTILTDYEREQRLECLRLAIANISPEAAVSFARELYAFVTGESDQTPRERITAALDAANVR